jgi:hypothetical protein
MSSGASASEPTGTSPDAKDRFPSAVSRGLLLFLAVSLGVPIGLALRDGNGWAAAILISTTGAVMAMLYSTAYRFAPPYLEIRSGFYRLRVPLAEISEVRKSTSLLSAPAAGFDRLEIRWGHRQSVLISPRDRAGFLRRLQRENPGIRFLPGAAPLH